ncbi:MAG: S-layer homology domain-containing protein, partial [Bacillota bacterium]
MRFKRLIATALAAAMILGLVSVGFAASFEDTEGFEFEASVLRLADLGIISGYPDGTFKPDNLVTRAEFAKMIVCMLGLESVAESLKGEAVLFADVDADHWAAGYINVAQMMGIVNGYEDGTFRPEGNITYAEALKMVLAAMGYSEDGFLVVRWPATWIAKAIELELDKDLTIDSRLPITRGEVAKLFDNSLTKKHVVVKDGEFVERGPAVTFMSKLKVNYIEGQVIDSPELWSNDSGKVKIKIDPDPEEPNDEVSFAIDDYEGLLGHKVKVWYKGDKVLGVEDLSTEKVLTAKEYSDIKEPPLIFINFIKHEGNKINVADADEIVVVYDGDGSTPIAVKAVKYKVGVITDIYSYGKRMDVYLESGTLKLYDFDVEYVGVDGFDDLKEGDILHYIYDADNDRALIIVARDVVKGTLTEITYDNKIKVDGKTFSVSKTILDALKALKDEVGEDAVGKVVVT